jgi:hypothetical protein
MGFIRLPLIVALAHTPLLRFLGTGGQVGHLQRLLSIFGVAPIDVPTFAGIAGIASEPFQVAVFHFCYLQRHYIITILRNRICELGLGTTLLTLSTISIAISLSLLYFYSYYLLHGVMRTTIGRVS